MPDFPVIFLNGPPRSGKDTAGDLLTETLRFLAPVKFAAALKQATHALFGFGQVGDAALEGVKETPLEMLDGMTPRQAYIKMSEELVKPNFDHEFFGRVLVRRINKLRRTANIGGAVVTDCGFHAEVRPVIDTFGIKNALLIRLHREGCTFRGDSRGYLEIPGVATIDIVNSGSRDGLRDSVVSCVCSWMAA